MAIPATAVGKMTMEAKKRIGLVAHDAKKDRLIDWVRANAEALRRIASGAPGLRASK